MLLEAAVSELLFVVPALSLASVKLLAAADVTLYDSPTDGSLMTVFVFI
jgi:hypothetical protein